MFLTVVVLLVSACSDPHGTLRAQPSATMSEATAVPTATIETSPTANGRHQPTGAPDAGSRATDGGRRARLCSAAASRAGGRGGPPRCSDGDADGTTYRVFLSAGCEGSWTEYARAPLGGVLQYAGPLFAVAVLYEEPDNWVGNDDVYGQYKLVFHPAAGVAQIFAPYVFVAGGQIVRTQVGCSTIERAFCTAA